MYTQNATFTVTVIQQKIVIKQDFLTCPTALSPENSFWCLSRVDVPTSDYCLEGMGDF